jgi:hypothetical protein
MNAIMQKNQIPDGLTFDLNLILNSIQLDKEYLFLSQGGMWGGNRSTSDS